MTSSKIFIDSDALFALTVIDDANHVKAVNILNNIPEEVAVYSLETTLAESVTTLSRKINRRAGLKLLDFVKNSRFKLIFSNRDLINAAETIFRKQHSKQNTFFDCLVMAAVKINDVATIFSFDKGYKTSGFKLLEDI